jgi:hypothetical protein
MEIEIIENVMDQLLFIANPNLDDYALSDAEARKMALSLI